MKSVTEFPSHILVMGINAKTALLAEGKTPEETQASLGITFKLEGDKLKYFFNALDVAAQNAKDLRRLVIVSLNEGENAPAKSVKIEEHYYVPEFRMEMNSNYLPKRDAKDGRGKGRHGHGGRGGGQKESPWGLSPEEKAAKKGGGKVAGAAAKKSPS